MSSIELVKGTLEEVTLHSRHLGTPERLLIYLPQRYSPLYTYPVLYVQDGDDYLSLGRLASLLDQFSAQKETADLIAVFLPIDKTKRTERYHPTGSAHHAYKRFLAEEVVSYVDRHYATNQLGNGRTLLGESLGGVVSLFTAFTYSHTFGQVACQSAAMDDELNDMLRIADPSVHLCVYLEVGSEETAVESSRGPLDLVKANRELHDLLQTKKVTLAYETFAGDHTWGYWQANLPRIIRTFFG